MISGIGNHGNPSHYDLHIKNFNSNELKFLIEYQHELERLRLMVAKLEIENERLKKGYWVEGVGANKVFVTEPDKSTKSSKH